MLTHVIFVTSVALAVGQSGTYMLPRISNQSVSSRDSLLLGNQLYATVNGLIN